MTPPQRPPRLAASVMARLARRDDREHCLGDLDEEFASRAAADPRAARAWYRRQLRSALRERIGGAVATSDRTPRRSLRSMLDDLRHAFRGLLGTPLTSIIAIGTFALGVAASSSIYTLLDHLVLRPLPFAEAERLVTLRSGFDDGRPGRWASSFPEYLDYREAATLDRLEAWQTDTLALRLGTGQPSRVRVVAATAGLLPLLGIEPEIGRVFTAEEDAVDSGGQVALISYALFRTRFGADPTVVGRSIWIDEREQTVIGVLPPGFTGALGGDLLPAEPVDVWLPYRSAWPATGMHLRGLSNVSVVGRMAPGVSLEQARAEVTAIAQRLAGTHEESEGEMAFLEAGRDAVSAGLVEPLRLLFGAVSFVLLIACTNVANLLVGRASARRRELAVRAALGASGRRLLRQMLLESGLLALLGAAIGCGLGVLGLKVLVGAGVVDLPGAASAGIDLRVLAFVATIAVGGGLLFGLPPALHTARAPIHEVLRTSGRTSTRPTEVLRRMLASVQVAGAVVLLCGAGLSLRSFLNVVDVDPGFDPASKLTARIQLPMEFVDPRWPEAVEFFDALLTNVRALPGVESAAAGYWLPIDGGWNNAFTFQDRPPTGTGQDDDSARFVPVTPGYFDTLGVRLLDGRTFTHSDDASAPGAVVVNEEFVRRYFRPGERALGVRLDYYNWWGAGPVDYEIVGIVQDVRSNGRTRPVSPITYFAHAQQPVREMSIIVRTQGDPMAMAPALRAEVTRLDAGQPLDDIATLEQRLARTEQQRQSLLVLIALFAGLSITLAGLGVYGVMAFLVGQRTRELGIRMALGARAATVRRRVLTQGLALVAPGLALGIAGAFALSGALRDQLVGVSATDPLTLIQVGGFVVAVALVATWLPSRRATSVDPARTLRAS